MPAAVEGSAPPLSPMGIKMVAHAIIAFGTPAQKDYFLPRILTGHFFKRLTACQYEFGSADEHRTRYAALTKQG